METPVAGAPLRIQTIPSRRGLIMRPLMFGPDPGPLPDESLLGLLARTADRNAWDLLSRVLGLADIDTYRTWTFPTTGCSAERDLAFVLRVEPNDVACRMHPELKLPGRRHVHVDFFGTPIRASYRETRLRRVSPLSLRTSPHHRATWDLRPLCFCADSREILIHRCPVCGNDLRWRRTAGIQHCEACVDEDGDPTVDLRDHPQPLVEVADETALSFLGDVIHPDPDRRGRARRAVAPEFSALSPGDLFEVVLSIARATAGEPGRIGTGQRKYGSLEGFDVLTPEILTRSARVLLTWPRAYCDLADRMRVGAAARTSRNGMLKEIGSLALLAWSQDLPDEARAAFDDGNRVWMDGLEGRTAGLARFRRGLVPEGYITQKEAARRLRMRAVDVRGLASRPDVAVVRMTDSATGPVLYRADQIARIDEVRRDLIEDDAAALRLGVPLWATRELVERGHLVAETGPAAALRSEGLFLRTSSVDALVARLEARVAEGPFAARLVGAVRKAASPRMPWPALIEAILDGRMNLHWSRRPRASFVENVALVDLGQFTTLVESVGPAPEADKVQMSDREAALALGTIEFTVCKLVEAGLLAVTGARFRRHAVPDLASFQARYAFTSEIATTLGSKAADVRLRLTALGIQPIAEFGDGKQLVWSREHLSGERLRGKGRLTDAEAAKVLGVGVSQLRRLVAAGLLRRGAGRWGVDAGEVQRFRSSCLPSSEAARILGLHVRQVPDWMEGRGLEPVARLPRTGGWVWDRPAFEALLVTCGTNRQGADDPSQ